MIFLSHSSKDNDRVRALGEELRRLGSEVWLDGEQITLADSIPRAMSGGLDRAERFVAIWSFSAASSPHVANELDAFYMKAPEPRRMLFLRLDATPVPALYAARIYLRGRNPKEDAAEIHAWSLNGQPPEASEILTGADPTPEQLRLFPRGPMVPGRWIPSSLVRAYGARYKRETEARSVMDRAVEMRLAVDPNDPGVTTVSHGDLPLIEKAGANEYWALAFGEAALHGPRMLAALVLAVPDDLFDVPARRERAELLIKLRLIA